MTRRLAGPLAMALALMLLAAVPPAAAYYGNAVDRVSVATLVPAK